MTSSSLSHCARPPPLVWHIIRSRTAEQGIVAHAPSHDLPVTMDYGTQYLGATPNPIWLVWMLTTLRLTQVDLHISTPNLTFKSTIFRDVHLWCGLADRRTQFPPTVEKWDQKESAYIQSLRFIRIFSSNPQLVVISRPGKHAFMVEPNTTSNSMCTHWNCTLFSI